MPAIDRKEINQPLGHEPALKNLVQRRVLFEVEVCDSLITLAPKALECIGLAHLTGALEE
jgi:hypothetical protein